MRGCWRQRKEEQSVKKYLAGLAVCLAAGWLAGCGDAEKKEIHNIKIGVTVYDQYDTFVSQLMERFNDYASSKEEQTGTAIGVDVYNAAGSQLNQNSQVEKMISDGCGVVCVNLVDRTEPASIIDLAEKHRVPVIFFNRELVEEDLERWDQLYYVGAKALESGIMEGELAAEAFRERPQTDKNGDGIIQYMILEGEAGHQDAVVRTEYAVSTIVEKGIEVEKLGYAIANWNRAQAQSKMTQMYGEYGDQIELVLANNDDMALGAIDALQAAGVAQENWPVILGIDGTDAGLEAVRDGRMAGTVYNDKEGQAKAMLELAFQLSTEGTPGRLELEDGKYIRLPYAKIGPEEAGELMK